MCMFLVFAFSCCGGCFQVNKLSSIIWWTFLGLIAVAAAVANITAYTDIKPLRQKYLGMQHRRIELQNKIDNIKKEIRLYRENQDNFKNNREFVIRLAHEEKLVDDKEIVFIFDNSR